MRTIIASVAVLWAARAIAAPAATGVPAPQPLVLPTLHVSGSTDGTSTIDAGLSIRKQFNDPFLSLTFEPGARTSATNGVANLFSASSGTIGAGKPWQVTLQLTLSHAPDMTVDADTQKSNDRRMLALKHEIVVECQAECAAGDRAASSHACKLWESRPPGAPPPEHDRALVAACDGTGDDSRVLALSKQIDIDTDKELRDARAQLPNLDISVALGVGEQDFSFLDDSGGGVLTPTTRTQTNVQLGALLIWLSKGSGLSLELPARFASTYSAQSTTAQYCSPAGTVMLSATDMPSAQVCGQNVLGAPIHQVTGAVSLLAGFVDWKKQIWRASAGIDVLYTSTSVDGSQTRLGAVFPVYLSLVKARANDQAFYHGLIRFVPALYWTHDNNGWNSTLMLTLELLGDRTLFGGRAKDGFQ